MASLTNHLIRRGMEELQTSFRGAGGPGHHHAAKEQFRLPAWSATLVIATIVLFVLGQFAIQYTYGELIATLAAVEEPSSTAIVRTPPEDSEESDHPDAPLLSVSEKADAKEPQNQEILLIKQKALTSRFCTIKRHLRAHGGRGARFRGLGVYILNGLLFSIIMGLVSLIAPTFSATFTILEIGAYMLLTPLELLWNHTVISKPSTKTWRQRIAPRSIVRLALLPTFSFATISLITQRFINICVLLPIQLSFIPQTHKEMGRNALLLLTSLFLFVAIQVPLEIAIVRVRASLLSTEEEPIVPFDRTFNGQVVPGEKDGRGILNLWQAWKGCSMQTRLRVLGVLAKVLAMHVAWIVFGALVLYGEARLILGSKATSRSGLGSLLGM